MEEIVRVWAAVLSGVKLGGCERSGVVARGRLTVVGVDVRRGCGGMVGGSASDDGEGQGEEGEWGESGWADDPLGGWFLLDPVGCWWLRGHRFPPDARGGVFECWSWYWLVGSGLALPHPLPFVGSDVRGVLLLRLGVSGMRHPFRWSLARECPIVVARSVLVLGVCSGWSWPRLSECHSRSSRVDSQGCCPDLVDWCLPPWGVT